MAGIVVKSKRKLAITVLAALLLLSVGFLAGFYISKYLGQQAVIRSGPPPKGPEASGVPILTSRNPGAGVAALRQLPPPWTAEGQQLAVSDSTNEATRDLYTWFDDALAISEQQTSEFLAQLRANGMPTANLTGPEATVNMTEVFENFEGVARDVLSYLRFHGSQALLPLLRQFASQGTLTLSDVDPDVFRDEVFGLLNLTRLGHWYVDVGSFDARSDNTRPPAAWDVAALPPAGGGRGGGTEQLLAGPAASGRADKDDGRRRRRQLLHADRGHRKLAALGSGARVGAPIPVISAGQEAAIKDVPPTLSPLMTLQDMLCSVRGFSPTGLQGMFIPERNASKDKPRPIVCPPPPKPALFRYNKTVFRPVKIPVAFHVQRFQQGDVLMPPVWKAEEAAKNLISVANDMYLNASIQFELKEVRVDPAKHPYLLLGSLKDWQQCTGYPDQEEAGFPCLQETARDPSVAALAKQYVINVFIGGSQTSMFCNKTESEACSSLYLGYTGSIGPWFRHPSPTWSEDAVDQNWLFITWDQFSPMVKNDWRFWNGGGVTLAHELGHYLGLMHTHEGDTTCAGNGFDKADAVPDTPVNKQTVQWAAENGLAVKLAKWCSEFRGGKKPSPAKLFMFNSCKQDAYTIDNVFNMLSYLPDACCMMLSPNQIARLQWAVAAFRPKMMRKYASKV